jgi:hypothetical protein
MSDPIVLSEHEKYQLGLYISGSDGVDDHERAQGVIDRLNRMRAPLPVGTVKADGDEVAFKASEKFERPWLTVNSEARVFWSFDRYVDGWSVVYKPETDK